MGFKYNHDAVSGLLMDTRNRCNGVMNALQKNEEKAQKVMEGDAWLGNKADNVRDYLGYVYSSINAGFGKAVEALECQVELYNSECLSIDSDKHAVIHENRVKEIEDDFQTFRYKMLPVGDDANRAIQSVADLAQVRRVELSGLENQLDKVQNELTDLVDSINDNETQFEQRFSHDIAELIQKTAAFIKYAQGQKDITKFSSSSLSKCKEYQALAAAYNKVSDQLEVDAEKIAKAQKTNDAMVAELQKEYEERVKKAQRLKLLAGIVCVVATVAVSALTCGAGTVACTVITGAVTGAFSAGVGSYAEQQIGTLACPGKVSVGKIVFDSAVGGCIGAATSFVGAKFDALKVTGSGLKTMVKNATVEGLKKTSQGLVTRGIEETKNAIETGDDVNILNVFNVKSMAADYAGGFAGSMATDYVSQKLPKSWTESRKREAGQLNPLKDNSQQRIAIDTSTLGQRMERSIGNGIKATVGNTASITVSTTINKGSISEGLSEGFDLERMGTDFVMTTGTAMATEYINYMQDKRTLTKLQKQVDDKAKEFNGKFKRAEEKWAKMGVGKTENGGPTFSGNKHCAAEVEFEQTYSENGGYRKEDYNNAFNRMAETGQINKEDFDCSGIDGGTVTRKSDGKVFTLHHVDNYDVRTGKTSMQLVEKDFHDQTKPHAGSVSQIEHAYQDYGAGKKLDRYNNMSDIANKQAGNVKAELNYHRKQFDFIDDAETSEAVPEGTDQYQTERFTFKYAQ